jgi:hypothetical protein
MAEKIATGISSGLWGSYNTVRSSNQNGFPVIGIGCWVGDRADRILNDIGNLALLSHTDKNLGLI